MFLSLWCRLCNGNPVPSEGKCQRGGERHSHRPRLEPLEDRVLPASWGSGAFAAAVAPGAVGGLAQAGSKPPGGTTSIQVSVNENSSPTVINLSTAFGAVSGLQQGDGLKL